MNHRQRMGVFVAAVLAIVLIVLHSPWTGYTIDAGPSSVGRLPFESSSLPLSQWHTNDPLIQWFGNCMNFVAVLAAICALLALWHRLFKGDKSAPVSTSAHGD